jgi:thermitase
VGVIDSGFDVNHPGLAGKIVDTQDFSGDKTLTDKIGHGTRVSGIIAGKNGSTGICPDCRLLVAKLGSDTSNGAVTEGILWATKRGAKVINLSIVTEGYSKLTEEAVNFAWDNGVVLVAAAGNKDSSQKVYPAGYEHVIAVAATDEKDRKTSFSNYGNWVMLAAPGVNIYTTQNDGQYGNVSGTSASSPIVAGIAALVWASQYGTSNADVMQRLCDTADKEGDRSSNWHCGHVNAEAAVSKTTATKQTRIGLLQTLIRNWSFMQ